MKLKERRLHKTGDAVPDWKPCTGFLERYRDRQLVRNLEEFLREHPDLQGQYALTGGHGKDAPRIEIEFQMKRSHPDIPVLLRQKDVEDIIDLQYRLVSPGMWRNLSSEASSNAFGYRISIQIRNYAPYMEKQEELLVYAPTPFGGGASPPPDPLYYLFRPRLPFEPRFFPPKGEQGVLPLGHFTECGNSTHGWSDIHPPRVTFSVLDPGEVDDLRFDYPPLPEKEWQQIEFSPTAEISVRCRRQDEAVRPKEATSFIRRSILNRIVRKLTGYWRKFFFWQ